MSQSPRFDQLVRNAKSAVREISPEDARRLQLEGAVLIDVREADEYSKGHAAEAIQLGRGVLELKIEQAVPDPTTPIVCYCGGGSRSALSADSLQRMGYSNVASLAGGFRAWREKNLPTA